jgi:hypothetical protein
VTIGGAAPERRKRNWEGNRAAEVFWRYARFHPRQIWWGEYALALLGGVGGGLVGYGRPRDVSDIVAITAALVGIVVGGVVAGMAILAAGLDTPFLVKLNKLGIESERYLSPFLGTTAIGIAAIIASVSWVALADVGNCFVRTALGAGSGGLTLWALGSLVPALGTLVQFVGLRQESTESPPR